jgi:hypothetical protein
MLFVWFMPCLSKGEVRHKSRRRRKTMTNKKQMGARIVRALMILGLVLLLHAPILAQGGPPPNNQACCLPVSDQPLTADETKWMGFMREEEKLARDVYQQLNAKWNLRIFANITRSEERHFSSVGALLARYDVKDPAQSTSPGVYADPNLAALYTTLIAKGTISVKDALEVGVLIEKQDIEDLEAALKATSKTDLKTVYTNLLAGSLSHLDAFENTLEVLVVNP